MTPFEGLEDSGRPCAEVLSVPGFFASLGPFPAGRRFILRVKERGLPPREVSLFQTNSETGDGSQCRRVQWCVPGCIQGGTYQGVPTRVW